MRNLQIRDLNKSEILAEKKSRKIIGAGTAPNLRDLVSQNPNPTIGSSSSDSDSISSGLGSWMTTSEPNLVMKKHSPLTRRGRKS